MSNSRARHLLEMIDATVQSSQTQVLSAKEQEFTDSMDEWLDDGRVVTEKQLEWLEAINKKCVYR